MRCIVPKGSVLADVSVTATSGSFTAPLAERF